MHTLSDSLSILGHELERSRLTIALIGTWTSEWVRPMHQEGFGRDDGMIAL